MCGIFAMFNPPGKKADLAACRRATQLLAHRGPDACGEWVSPSGEVFLGFRRLSILDLTDAASQPMTGPSGRVLIFNGEIYNFRSLRDRIGAQAGAFRSTGDTEVLLRALELWGTKCLTDLEGMFAFVFWSPADQEALIARDFFGIKPLYLCHLPDGGVAVASEIKAFCALPGFAPELNAEALPEYLRFRSVTGAASLLKGVEVVQPGQWLKYNVRTQSWRSETYWSPHAALDSRPALREKTSDAESFCESFGEIVARHLIADVPVGAQFSGGVDSGLVSAIAVREQKAQLTGFFCRVEDSEFDESPFAADMASQLGIPLQEAVLAEQDLGSDLLEQLTWHMDEPLAHPNAMGVYLVSRQARGKVKALLSGEAADESFAGYAWYSRLLLQDRLRRLPGFTRRWAGFCRPRSRRARYWLDFYARSGGVATGEAIFCATQFMDPELVALLLGDPAAGEASLHRRRPLLERGGSLDLLTRAQLYDIATYLPALLVRQDKMSMAASIENRVPFATPQTLAMALGLPGRRRATIAKQKPFLKSCLARYVPGRLVYRRKCGFGIPLARWLNLPSGRARIAALAGSGSGLQGLMDMGVVRRLAEGFDGTAETAEPLWILLSLDLWAREFLRGGYRKRVTAAGTAREGPDGRFITGIH